MATSKTKAKTGRATRAPAKPAPHRYRFSVPAADEAVSAWMETQDDPSHSLRALIRENIERHGYTDIVNRPVAQLPKRGRPVAGDADFVEEEDAAQQPAPTTQPKPAPKTQAEPVAPVAAVAVEPEPVAEVEPEPEPEQDPVVSEYIPEVMGPDIANFIPGLDDDEDELVIPAPAPATAPTPAPATPTTPVETSSGAGKAFDNNIFGALR